MEGVVVMIGYSIQGAAGQLDGLTGGSGRVKIIHLKENVLFSPKLFWFSAINKDLDNFILCVCFYLSLSLSLSLSNTEANEMIVNEHD